MWKPEHRLAADRRGLRYPSDLTDAEWAIVAPMIPPGRHGGRRRSVNVREVLNGKTVGERARGSERDLLRAVDRLPMEGAAQGSAAEEHGARLSRALELGRHLGAHPSRAVRGGARGGGA